MAEWGFPASEKGHRRKDSGSFHSDMPSPRGLGEGATVDDDKGFGEFGGHNVHNDKALACYHCGEEGHIKAQCPKREPLMCHHCKEEGHIAKQCPGRSAVVCKNCKEEGHVALECNNNRKLDFDSVASMTPDDAWKLIQDASDVKDLDDFREALEIYQKAVPDLTYKQLEVGLRSMQMNIYIIALDKPVDEVYTVMDMQGKLGMKYCIGYFFSPKCQRKIMQPYWPSSPEENLERLDNAGMPVDRFVVRCDNCKKLGHIAKTCREEKMTPEITHVVHCFNCEEDGHRMRDCPKPRIDKFACRNCNKRGHDAKDCTAPHNPDNVVCKNCEKKGHFVRDCPDRPPETCNNCGQEGHRARECTVQKCRNCDEEGHLAKECPKPRDYTRVKCNNCGQMGHTKVRCKEPPKEDTGDFATGDFGGFGDDGNAAVGLGSFRTLKVSDNADDNFGKVGSSIGGAAAAAADNLW